MGDFIEIQGARENNLKNLSLKIPKNKLIVLTGISGSGKSTLAFDTLQKECQRQYMASLGMVTDFLSKPRVDSIKGLSPSISVDQNLTNRNPRSTVGTVTEVFTYLRLLYAKLGGRPCPGCGTNIKPSFENDNIFAGDLWDNEDVASSDAAMMEGSLTESRQIVCPACKTVLSELTMADFSFNKPDGACPACTGLGVVSKPDVSVILEEDKSIPDGGVTCWDNSLTNYYTNAMIAAGKYYGFNFNPDTPVGKFDRIQRDYLLYGVNSDEFKQHFPDKKPPSNALSGRFEGIITAMLRKYADHEVDDHAREKLEKYLVRHTCPDCNGARLKAESRMITVAGEAITQLSRKSLDELDSWIKQLPQYTTNQGMIILQPVLNDLADRIKRLVDVGLGYLSMERPAMSLSGGEAQRLRLASLLGSGLTGVLYVLDEPTTGLHPRDTDRLIRVLKQLRDLGNTVLVIEHDIEMMRAADCIIDIGPGAGRDGGTLVAAGTPSEIGACNESITGRYLSGTESIDIPENRRKPEMKLTIEGAREHNLRNITVDIPLGMLVSVTGVSGSGKSTLLFDILDKAARQRYYGAGEMPGRHDGIKGWEYLDKVITIDQTPIGRIPRSNAATYTDTFTAIRNVFTELPEAKKQRLLPRHFSFNVPGGRCEKCQGAGVLSIKMHFLPEVQVMCPACRGARFKREILEVKYGGSSISEVLNMAIQDAAVLFKHVGPVADKLDLLNEVGLGYLKLGQPATTLSGGEAQRIKLSKELSRKGKGHTLYLLDEPTVGLHPHDAKKLISVLQRLVDAGNTVVVIEHNLDVIKTSDWVIDFGPEGGRNGGEILACGTPEQVVAARNSHTGRYLGKVFS
jgi:excinuclease ABC subunit A